MNDITLDAVMDTIHRLPSLPAIVNELLLALSNEGLSVNELTHGIEKDQALSARALRAAIPKIESEFESYNSLLPGAQ